MKETRYKCLVARRQSCHLCEGLENPADVAGGIFDSQEIGPWSRWQGNLHSRIMIIGQDWGSKNYFTKYKGIDANKNPTNVTLTKLLEYIGVRIWIADKNQVDRGELFLTNAILCLKPGNMRSKLRDIWIETCSKNYLKEQIDIVSPKIIICLGKIAFDSLLMAIGHNIRYERYRDVVEKKGGFSFRGWPRVFPVYHCGSNSNMNRPCPAQIKDWENIRRFLGDV